MITTLVSFGCSWAQGDELVDPVTGETEQYRATHAYPGLVAAHFGWALDDRSMHNASLTTILHDFAEWVSSQSESAIAESVVIIGLTDEARADVTDSDSAEDRYNKVVHAIDDIATKHKVRLLQFNVLATRHKIKLPSLIDSSSILEMLVIRNRPRTSPLFKQYKHPNEAGHCIISEFLIRHIKSVIVQYART